MSEEFSESRIPLAYLITFRCYGTWLHGDERGSVDRGHNIYDTPFLPRNETREKDERQRLKQPPVKLDQARRVAVDRAVREVCTQRGWALLAINVRTNHAHIVVSAQCNSKKVLNDFKAYATRGMRKAGVWRSAITPWAEHGSRKYLWKPASVERAIDYVLNHQGDDLIPNFDEEQVADAPRTAPDAHAPRTAPDAHAPRTAPDADALGTDDAMQYRGRERPEPLAGPGR
jgi:REP element-mobilizing transposase RayT